MQETKCLKRYVKNDDYVAWERQPNEGAKAYEAFCIYRDMGTERRIVSVAAKLSKSVSLIGRWNIVWCWADRVREYDTAIQREASAKAYKKIVAELEEMQLRHIRTAVLMQLKATSALNEIDISSLSAQDIVKLIKEGTALEQNARSYANAEDMLRKNNNGINENDIEDLTPLADMLLEKDDE